MKSLNALSAAAVLAVASGAARGQATSEAFDAAVLKMRIVPVDVTQASPLNLSFQGDNVHNDVLLSQTGPDRVRRFSVQYQIAEGAGYEGFIACLADMRFNITGTVSVGALESWSWDRALLTRVQGSNNPGGAALDSADPAGATDISGNATGSLAGVTGLHRAWRSALMPAGPGGNTLPDNGAIAADGIIGIRPLTLTQRDQHPLTYPGAWFGVYDFTVSVDQTQPGPDVVVNLEVQAQVDPQSGFAWAGFEDGSPVVKYGRNFSSTGASFRVQAIPAPGALAIVGFGLSAVHRRRRRIRGGATSPC